MVHDPSAPTPRCRLQAEDGDEYGGVVPEGDVAEAIRQRTETHLRALGATVSSKVRGWGRGRDGLARGAMLAPCQPTLFLHTHSSPACFHSLPQPAPPSCTCPPCAVPIPSCTAPLHFTALQPIVMRAEFAYCPNLTIIDTPGFILKARKGEPDSTPDDILAMVKAQCAPPHRLILFLQQSSVEWCSSLWINVVQEVDPHYQRTSERRGLGRGAAGWGGMESSECQGRRLRLFPVDARRCSACLSPCPSSTCALSCSSGLLQV